MTGASILIALGMLGAIVMPHNIYLHSNVIQSRDWDVDPTQRARLMHFELADTTLAMGMGWLVNSAMIIVAAAVFFTAGVEVTSIEQASQTLEPLVGAAAQLIFGIALLAAGLASSVTASLAEANIVTGYLGRPEDPRTRTYKLGPGRAHAAGDGHHRRRRQRLPGAHREPGRAEPAAAVHDHPAALAEPARAR